MPINPAHPNLSNPYHRPLAAMNVKGDPAPGHSLITGHMGAGKTALNVELLAQVLGQQSPR